MKLIEIDPKQPEKEKIIGVLKKSYDPADFEVKKNLYMKAVEEMVARNREIIQLLTTLEEGDIVEIKRGNRIANRNCIITQMSYHPDVSGPIPYLNIVLDRFTASPGKNGNTQIKLRGTPFSIGYTKEWETNSMRVDTIIKYGHADIRQVADNNNR